MPNIARVTTDPGYWFYNLSLSLQQNANSVEKKIQVKVWLTWHHLLFKRLLKLWTQLINQGRRCLKVWGSKRKDRFGIRHLGVSRSSPTNQLPSINSLQIENPNIITAPGSDIMNQRNIQVREISKKSVLLPLISHPLSEVTIASVPLLPIAAVLLSFVTFLSHCFALSPIFPVAALDIM